MMFQEFLVGKTAAPYVTQYHSLHHFKYRLYQRCRAKVGGLSQALEMVRRKGGGGISKIDISEGEKSVHFKVVQNPFIIFTHCRALIL